LFDTNNLQKQDAALLAFCDFFRLVYEQAPRLIHVIMGAVTLIPTALVLRRLLARNSYPIINAVVILYFVGQLRILAASLPVLARFNRDD
jgi:multisubunit Na+/H+ antiporter MnhE subunit